LKLLNPSFLQSVNLPAKEPISSTAKHGKPKTARAASAD
jgi:hypothetical protein